MPHLYACNCKIIIFDTIEYRILYIIGYCLVLKHNRILYKDDACYSKHIWSSEIFQKHDVCKQRIIKFFTTEINLIHGNRLHVRKLEISLPASCQNFEFDVLCSYVFHFYFKMAHWQKCSEYLLHCYLKFNKLVEMSLQITIMTLNSSYELPTDIAVLCNIWTWDRIVHRLQFKHAYHRCVVSGLPRLRSQVADTFFSKRELHLQ